MAFIPPIKLLIKSDGNELAYTKTEKTKSDILFYYTYTKSYCFLNHVICFNEKELLKGLKNTFVEI